MKYWKYIFISLLLLLPLSLAFNPVWFGFLSPKGKLIEKDLSGVFLPWEKRAVFNDQEIDPPLLAQEEPVSKVLGENNQSKRIEIDLTNQRLYAYEGGHQVFNFLISSGKWGKTPTGSFNIWIKLRYSKMEGGSKALNTYYYLPNVPYVMYFYNSKIPKWRGFGLHGTYWHDNFGHPMSHGCVNMKTEEVAQLYYWANPELRNKTSIYATDDNPGTQIIIYGKAPAS